MDKVVQRLTALETTVKAELGEDGRLRKDIGDVQEVVVRIDETLRGSNGAGMGERIRRLERNQGLMITGLGMALAGAARVGWEWVRGRWGA